MQPVFEVRQIPSAAALVAAGLGVTALPAFTLPMFNFPTVRAIPLGQPVIERQIGVLRKRSRHAQPHDAALIELLKAPELA